MFREKLLTIIIGLIVGALLAAMYFFGPQLVKNMQNENVVSPTPAPTQISPTPANSEQLTIISPEDSTSTTNSEIKVSGTASPNAKLVLFANAGQKQFSAGSNGKFETTAKLEDGENEISVSELSNPIQTTTINVTLEISD